jgi:hypothetical protein
MNYTEVTKPGMGDPYWYEWSIGQQYILDMLNPDSNISSVSLQENISLGLDDIVVKYNNDEILCVQVKHTRSNDTITFGNIVSQNDEEGKGNSLLAQLAEGWYEEKENFSKIVPCIYTNRKIGTTTSKAKIEGKKEKYIRPSLEEFWPVIKKEIIKVESLSDVNLPKEEWNIAWQIWQEQLEGIKNDKDKIEFLRLLEIETNKPSLKEVEGILINKLSEYFSITKLQAESLLASLDHALRKWTTSERSKIKVCAEDVYEVLSLNKAAKIFNHDLRPPYPFFYSRKKLIDELKKEFLEGKSRITFLSGLPGMGKTSVVSSLTNDHESAIDIRYFAYEPIKFDSEYLPFDVNDRINMDIFWSEMLSQLRGLLKGSLSKYKVPLRNDFLSVKDMRAKFLMIAECFGKDRGRPVIVAIDGIDHAARAGASINTFLETLINPEYITDNIKFFISGQPIEAYPNYPRWLKKNNGFISYFEVPSIQEDDILLLIQSQNKMAIPKEDYSILAKLIYEFSEGNTLSAIFAVYEAKDSFSINEIKKKLLDRKLSGNITEYYNNIWESAINNIKRYFPFIEYRLAGCFSLIGERLNADILQKIFSDLSISKSDWNNILISLKPLVIEENDGYRLLHNDVRVFLTKIINSEKNRLADVASSIANYYKKLNEPSLQYYNDLFNFLELSNREDEIIELFTSSYVLSAYVKGLEIYDLKKQSEKVFNIIREKKIGDWGLIHEVTCAVNTLTQIEKSMDGEEPVNIKNEVKVQALLESECSVIQKNYWTVSILSNTLEDILMLFDRNCSDRAIGLFMRWFHDLTLKDLIGLIPMIDKYESFGRNEKLISKKYRDLFSSFGRVLSLTNLSISFCNVDKNLVQDELYSTAVTSFFDGYMWQSVESFTKCALARRLKNVRIIYWSSYDGIILQLIKEQRILDLAIFIQHFGYLEKLPNLQILYNIASKVIINDKSILNSENRMHVFNILEKIELKFSSDFNEITAYCILSFSLGALDFSRDSEIIAKLVLEKYIQQHKYSDSRPYGAVIFNISAFMGEWIYCLNNLSINETKNFISVSKIETLFNALFNKKWTHNQEIYDSTNVKILLIECLNHCATISGGEYKKLIDTKLNELYMSFPVNYLLHCGWRYYYDRNQLDKLKEWFYYWCGDNGEIWGLDLSQRNQIAREFKELIFLYKLENLIPLKSFNDKLKWSVIGYAYHKDYSLEDSLDWFKELINLDASEWRSSGIKLMTISQAIRDIGDNRLDIDFISQFLSAVYRDGIDSVWQLYNSEDFMKVIYECNGNSIDGIIGMLKNASLSKEEMLSLWAFAIGSLDWRNNLDQSYLSPLRDAILLASKRLKITDIEKEMKSLGCAEYESIEDVNRFRLPWRWIDDVSDIDIFDTSGVENIVQGIDEIINESNGSKDNSYLLLLFKQLKKENMELYKIRIKKALYAIDSPEKGYGWRNTGKIDIYQYILTEVDEDEAVEFLLYILDKRLNKIEMSWELDYLNKDIANLCLWRSCKNGIEDLKVGLNRLIDMHFLWLTSDNHIRDIKIIELGNTLTSEFYPKTWSEFVMNRLFYLLRCEDLEKVECSLRGIWALIKIDSANIKSILKYWDLLHFRAQEWILFIIERCIYINAKIKMYKVANI